jgi:hypothetical protein
MRVLFAHPADVAAADQAAAALAGATVRLRRRVPEGRIYVVGAHDASRIQYGFELGQLAERVIELRPATARRGESDS